jgi:hypothetical protein
MNLLVPPNAGKFSNTCITGGFSRRAQFHGVSYPPIYNPNLSNDTPVFWLSD